MTDADHFRHYLEFLNPSLPEQRIGDPVEFFDPEKSFQEKSLTQTEPFFSYTMIVEEGESYTTYVRTVDPAAQPIIVQANGKLTTNYLC